MLDFRDSGQETESCDSAKDVNKEMLWFSSTRRKLDFRDAGQETESYTCARDLKKEMLGFWSTGQMLFHGF